MNRRYEAVIFDLGRVLVRVDISPWTTHFFPDRDPGDIETALQQIMSEDVVRRFMTGAIDGPEFHRQMGRTYGADLAYDDFVCIWRDIFSPMPGMEPLVRELNRTYKLGLLSDTDAIHWDFLLGRYPFLKLIPNPTLSFRIHAMKPDPKSYQAAAASVDTPIENCFYIDDLPRNVEGARKAGMAAVRFESADQLRRDLENAGIL